MNDENPLKEALLNLCKARILFSEYLQGYNKPNDPHLVLYKNYIDLIDIQELKEELADSIIGDGSSINVISILDNWIKYISPDDLYYNFNSTQVKKDVEKLLGALYKDYKFDIIDVKKQVKELKKEIKKKQKYY